MSRWLHGYSPHSASSPQFVVTLVSGYKLLDEIVLKEMMVELSKELEHGLHETWSKHNYQVDTLMVVPHYHGSLPSLPSLLHIDAVISDLPHRPLLPLALTETSDGMPQEPTSQPSDRSASELTVMTYQALMDHPPLPDRNTSSELRLVKHSTQITPRKLKCGVERKLILVGGQRIKDEMSSDWSENIDVRLKLPEKDLCNNVEIKEEPVCSGVCSYYICCVQGCTSTNKTCMLFPFPTNSQQAMTWVERSSRQDLLPFLNLNGAVPNNFLLCRRHFHDDQLVRRGDREVLKELALPTLFPAIGYEGEKLLHEKIMDPISAPAQYADEEAGTAALRLHDYSRNRERSDVKYNGNFVTHRPLREHLQRSVTAADMKSMKELDEEIEHLKNELHLLCTATSHRHRAYVYDLKREPARIAACKAQFRGDNDKAALARLRPRLIEATYQLMKQQLATVTYPRWNGSVEATRLPLIMSTVGLKVYSVLRRLYALPSLAHVCGYRVKARRNPYLYGHYMSEFVKKQHRSRHHPAVRKYFGAMRKTNKPSVAKVLEKYVKMGDRLLEPSSVGEDRKP